MFVYVINKNGESLMPCKPAKAKHLLREGKAKVKQTRPFTIKLLWNCENPCQPVTAGMDTGSKIIGSAATTNGQVVYQAETQIRQDETILPVTEWKVETASFDIHKITNQDVKGVGYRKGDQKDYYNVKAYILHRDNYKCQSGRKVKHSKKRHVHHPRFRSKGGTNTLSNLVILCESCHVDLHDGKFDFIKTNKGIGFIKGKRSSGFFALMDILNNTVTASVSVKKNCTRLTARTTTLIGEWQFLPEAKDFGVSLPQNL